MSDVTLHVMNPRGEIEPLPVYAPSPRLDGIASKTIGLYSNSKHGMDNFYEALADKIKAAYPGAVQVLDSDSKAKMTVQPQHWNVELSVLAAPRASRDQMADIQFEDTRTDKMGRGRGHDDGPLGIRSKS